MFSYLAGSLPKRKTLPTSAIDMTLKNLMLRFQ